MSSFALVFADWFMITQFSGFPSAFYFIFLGYQCRPVPTGVWEVSHPPAKNYVGKSAKFSISVGKICTILLSRSSEIK